MSSVRWPARFATPRRLQWFDALTLAIRWSPLVWLIGLAEPFAFASVALAAISLLRAGWRRLVWPAALGSVLVLALGVGLTLAWERGEPVDRVIAAAYNLAVWVVGMLALLVVAAHPTADHRARLLRSIRDAGLVAAAAGAITLGAWTVGVRQMAYGSPAAALVPANVAQQAPALLSTALRPVVFRSDWFQGAAVPRLQAFHPYPNALALALGLALVAQIALGAAHPGARRRRGRARWFAASALAGALVLTWSRVVLLGLAGLLAGLAVLRRVPVGARLLAGVGVVGATAVTALVLSLGAPDVVARVLNEVGQARAGSTATRVALYVQTVDLALDRPWFGHGVKPRPEGSVLPLGSHSTALGTLLKGGFVAFTLLAIAAVALGMTALRDLAFGPWVHRPLAVAILLILGWGLVEDLDAPVVVAVQAFATLGLWLARDAS